VDSDRLVGALVVTVSVIAMADVALGEALRRPVLRVRRSTT
jgi:hypothetical protein